MADFEAHDFTDEVLPEKFIENDEDLTDMNVFSAVLAKDVYLANMVHNICKLIVECVIT